MTTLPYTSHNKQLIQDFIDETKTRVSNGATLTFTRKAQDELSLLNINYNITTDDIENAILNLSTEDYYRGINPSGQADFDVCAFYNI